ncbi:MAG: hypothetical protein GF400_08940 [Candidatus Eisenbacteria bacterium]|nr:hypothetical protein [Candidatus Eisenbacteria bacterium]
MRDRRFRTAAIALALAALASSPATAGDDGTVEYFDGGSLRTEVRLSLGFLYGLGARPDGLGAPVSTCSSGLSAVGGNAAGLAFVPEGGILLDVLPPVGASLTDIVDLESRAETAIDESLEDVADDDLDPTYPSLSASAGQQPGLVSGALVLRLGNVVAGVAIEEPATLRLDLVENGIEAFAGGTKSEDEGDVDVEMRGFADAVCDLSFEIDRTTAALATAVTPELGLGATFSRYHARAAVDGVLRGDGIVNYGGQEYSFNDDGDAWENDLGGSISGSFEGEAFGWSVGASYRRFDWLTLDVHYSAAPEIQMRGQLVSVESMPAAATEDGIELSEISASQPTLTETTVDIDDDPMVLELPSHAAAAATARLGPALLTLECRVYGSGLGMRHDDYSEGVELDYGAGLELAVGALRLGGGALSGRLVGESADEQESTAVLIPLANLGMAMEFGENIGADLMVLALPMQVARVSVTYGF